MPYTIRKRDSQYCIYKQDADGNPTGDSLGCSDSHASAQSQIEAIYANENKRFDALRAAYQSLRMNALKNAYRAIANDQVHTGVMLAFYLPADVAKSLYEQVAPAIKEAGVEPVQPNDYHLTLIYAGDMNELGNKRDTIVNVLSSASDEDVMRSPIEGVISGVGRFATTEDDNTNALYVSLDAIDLPAFRQQLLERLQQKGVATEQTHGFTPHITIAYIPIDAPTPTIPLEPIEVKFQDIVLAWGDDKQEYILDGDAYQSVAKPLKSTSADIVTPDNLQMDDNEQSIWERTYKRVFDATGDKMKASLAAYGAVTRSRYSLSVKSAKKDGVVTVKGWGVLFSDASHKDLDQTWFANDTKYFLKYYAGAPLWIEHGQENGMGSYPIGMRSLTEEHPEHGIWVEHELDPQEEVFQLAPGLHDQLVSDIDAGLYAYSSDSLSHHVTGGYNPDTGKLNVWPLAGFSLVKRPAEPGLGPVTR